jgi:serine phosphatase RsbU (regulator of sigma subunit)
MTTDSASTSGSTGASGSSGAGSAIARSVDAGGISPAQAKLVLDVSRMLAVTTDLDALLTHIAQAACGLLDCERASIFLHDNSAHQLCTKVALQTTEIRVPENAGIVGAAFTGNQVLVVPNPYDDPRFNREVDKKTGFVTRNILAAPMANLDRMPIGVVQAINKRGGSFAEADQALIGLLADQAGVALQRYHLQQAAMKAEAMRHEMKLARRVQDAMLPKEMPIVSGIEAMGWTRPASVTGGDCFDLWRTTDNRLAVFLADASGHGLAPTLVVSQVRTLIRAFAEIDPNPRRLLEKANARLSADLEAERFCTAFLGFLDSDGQLEWCSAGHGPILFRPSGDEPIQELVPTELPLGVMPDLTGEPATTLTLNPGGMLAIISDGIFEAMNNSEEQFGMHRVTARLEERRTQSAPQLIATIRDAATEWTGSEEPVDDQTIVVVRRTG